MGWVASIPPEFTAAATSGADESRTGVDGLYDEAIAKRLLKLIGENATIGNLRFTTEPDGRLPDDPPARVVDAEQSNTSVIYDSAALLKIFRRVSPGINPDLELNRALGRAGCANVARLLGALESEDEHGQPVTLGMLTEYAINSAEGWAMATTSARDLFNQPEYAADEVGGDFAGESFRLGEAVANVHRVLADSLGVESIPAPSAAMDARLTAAAAAVPELAPYVPALREAFGRLGAEPVKAHRIHGDLHLGQVLRTPEAWLIIDFEGEPGVPVDERRRPDSPLRDVACMLRSYDYAARSLLAGEERDEALAGRAQEWIDRNRGAFCDGYAETAGFDPRDDSALLNAYELDKAVYEAAYEARHRPAWLRIPLGSIARLIDPSSTSSTANA